MPVAEYGSLPFEEQIAFFRGKRLIPTERWNDLWRAAHDRGFMVAGAMRDELLADLHQAVTRAIEEGGTLAEFRKDFDKIVATHGWDYKGSRGWRTRVIYETNVRQSYNAGRYEQMQRVTQSRPWKRYRHSGSSTNPRPLHLKWDGLVLRHDDPWLLTHSPQNGWGCKCRLETLADRDLRREGITPGAAPRDGTYEWVDKRTGEVHTVPKGIDPGFDYTPGRAANRSALTPKEAAGRGFQPFPDQPRASDPPPAPRPAAADLLMPAGRAEADYVSAFLEAFGVGPGEPLLYTDAAGSRVEISDALFRTAGGQYKVTKGGRERYVRLLAQAIQDPDEIWLVWGTIGRQRKVSLRRRYLARFEIEGGEGPLFVAFERDTRTWSGTTAFAARNPDYLLNQRVGRRVFRRTTGDE